MGSFWLLLDDFRMMGDINENLEVEIFRGFVFEDGFFFWDYIFDEESGFQHPGCYWIILE